MRASNNNNQKATCQPTQQQSLSHSTTPGIHMYMRTYIFANPSSNQPTNLSNHLQALQTTRTYTSFPPHALHDGTYLTTYAALCHAMSAQHSSDRLAIHLRSCILSPFTMPPTAAHLPTPTPLTSITHLATTHMRPTPALLTRSLTSRCTLICSLALIMLG